VIMGLWALEKSEAGASSARKGCRVLWTAQVMKGWGEGGSSG